MRFTDALATLLLGAVLATACTLGRVYRGQELPPDAAEQIHPGRSTVGEVLAVLGPPDRIVRTARGEVFTWRFERRNSSSFTIEEPVVTDLTIFSWSKVQDKSDTFMVFFDRAGVVTHTGHRRGTEELETF